MLIALFGGTGFIGGHLVSALLAEGYRIRLALMGDEKWLSKTYFHPKLELFAYDSQSEESVARVVKGTDRVVNLTGILNETKQRSFFTTHQQLPAFIAKACHSQRLVQLIHISALGAGAHAPSKYLQTKTAGEESILAEFPSSTTIIRPSIVLGSGSGFVRQMISIASMTPVLLLPCGLSRVQPIAVEDLVRLILFLLKDKRASKNEIINAAGPQAMRMWQLVSVILRPKRRIIVPMSYGLSYGFATMLEKLLRQPPITRDNCLSLSRDFLCSEGENHIQQLLGKLTEISEALK